MTTIEIIFHTSGYSGYQIFVCDHYQESTFERFIGSITHRQLGQLCSIMKNYVKLSNINDTKERQRQHFNSLCRGQYEIIPGPESVE
jgi:hypothetical protein